MCKTGGGEERKGRQLWKEKEGEPICLLFALCTAEITNTLSSRRSRAMGDFTDIKIGSWSPELKVMTDLNVQITSSNNDS